MKAVFVVLLLDSFPTVFGPHQQHVAHFYIKQKDGCTQTSYSATT